MTPLGKPRLFSGMQPSGELHIGNYLGAARQWVALARDGRWDTIYCVVDAHAITVEYDPAELPRRVLDAARTFLACGIDPERSVLFVQSDVREHTELAWYLAAVAPMGELGRMTQFKEKSVEQKQGACAGLYTYPVLMAADILLYRASVVPVGDDQVQHLELCREIARRFNARFGDTFPEPQPRLSATPRIMGLDGGAKMSKSRGNSIGLLDEPDEIWQKLRPAFTDPARQRRSDPGNPDVCNIFTMHKALSPPHVVAQIDRDCRSAAIGCIDCKKILHDHMCRELGPVRERGKDLAARPDVVVEALRSGAERARQMAGETMTVVRGVMGLGSRRPA